MKKKVRVLVANPAGNITIFVRDKIERKLYKNVADQLFEMEFLDPKRDKMIKGEQVAFILDMAETGVETDKKLTGAELPKGKMEMCGLEFCGNASRAFALIAAHDFGKNECTVPVDVSGCDEILNVEVNVSTGFAKIKMPNPERILDLNVNGNILKAVDFGGIFHTVAFGLKANIDTFDEIKNYVLKEFNPPALGVMFFEEEKASISGNEFEMIPVVYVKDVDTTYFEGSCATGTTAACAVFSLYRGEGMHKFKFSQPEGEIDAECIVKSDQIESIYIEGNVELLTEVDVDIDMP